jgi:hypothetical protein
MAAKAGASPIGATVAHLANRRCRRRAQRRVPSRVPVAAYPDDPDVALAMASRWPAPIVKAIVRAVATGSPTSASLAPVICEPYDFFELRAITSARVIACRRLSETSRATDAGGS